jgi:hypothetical protein
MGWGDELMAAGLAAHAVREAGPSAGRCAILGVDGRRRQHDAWKDDPLVAKPGETAGVDIVNGPGARPYIDRWDNAARRWHFRTDWRPYGFRPRLVLSQAEIAIGEELRAGGRYMTIEPNINPINSPNKDWGFDRWQEVVNRLPGVRFVQCLGPDSRPLHGVHHLKTDDFRQAAGVVLRAALHVGPEGGLHHAAAAFGTPAVIVFGGFVSPAVTGYPDHHNLGSGAACGKFDPCPECRAALDGITPAQVAGLIERFR